MSEHEKALLLQRAGIDLATVQLTPGMAAKAATLLSAECRRCGVDPEYSVLVAALRNFVAASGQTKVVPVAGFEKGSVGYQELFSAIAAAVTRTEIGLEISVAAFEKAVGGCVYLHPQPTPSPTSPENPAELTHECPPGFAGTPAVVAPSGEVVVDPAATLAHAIFAVGGRGTNRLAFKGGVWPDHETDLGGMNIDCLTAVIRQALAAQEKKGTGHELQAAIRTGLNYAQCLATAAETITRLTAELDGAKKIIGEVMFWHSDPKSSDYSSCEIEPCGWCSMARAAGAVPYSGKHHNAMDKPPAAPNPDRKKP